MPSKQVKVVLAALALLLATAVTSAHATPCSGIENCDSCPTSGKCETCSAGYTPADAAAATCVTCTMANCVTCSTSTAGTCTACDPGYEVASGSTTCTVIACGIENCKTCATATTCEACDDGYTVSADGATSCVTTTPAPSGAPAGKCSVDNCKGCVEGNNSLCAECNDKYALADNGTVCKDGVVAPARAAAAALAACVLAAAALAL